MKFTANSLKVTRCSPERGFISGSITPPAFHQLMYTKDQINSAVKFKRNHVQRCRVWIVAQSSMNGLQIFKLHFPALRCPSVRVLQRLPRCPLPVFVHIHRCT